MCKIMSPMKVSLKYFERFIEIYYSYTKLLAFDRWLFFMPEQPNCILTFTRYLFKHSNVNYFIYHINLVYSFNI